IGDNGEADFTGGVLTTIQSTATSFGGDDTVALGKGNNVVVGGLGADSITTGDGNDVIVGDSGLASFDAAGAPVTVYSTSPDVTGGGTATGSSSSDAILIGNGNNVVIGGSGADTIAAGRLVSGIRTGGDGKNIVIGDNGEADFTGGVLTTIQSTSTSLGGDDTVAPGKGNNAVTGGLGADAIT